nr:UDP-glucose 4-epimerase GalE [uncultured Halomonas sp.]
MTVLVTGGAGYIGSHAVLALLEAEYTVLVLDNLVNSSRESLSRVERLAGRQLTFIEGDIRDRQLLDKLFAEHAIEAVMHFAGLKAVGESVAEPLAYYANNVGGSVTLFQAMADAGVRRLVFSSSATVYGEPECMPLSEAAPTARASNPYGQSKLMVEEVLKDLARADARWSIALLRYFNPVGAHASGEIGEDPQGPPNNLMPYIAQVAVGKREKFSVFGGDYATRDGTGVRDYIHVVDLVEGHLRALEVLKHCTGAHAWNLGTGRGYSVLEMVAAFEAISGKRVPYTLQARREGDVAECWADPAKARKELDWQARRGLEEMMADTWRWQSKNPDGY